MKEKEIKREISVTNEMIDSDEFPQYRLLAAFIRYQNVDTDKVLKVFCDTCVSKRDWFCESLCKIKEKIDSVPTAELCEEENEDGDEE